MMRVKICGITEPSDARAAAAAGADAVGIICRAPSKRQVAEAEAGAIARALPPFVSPVLLFADAEAELVRAYLREVPAAVLQFHGDEDAGFCASFGRPYVRSIHPRTADDVLAAESEHPAASALLLDSAAGGSGTGFDWSAAPASAQRKLPLIVAGGLDASNVAAAIAATEPYAVDVSSGVCASGDPRRKDPAKMEQFVAAARSARA